MFIKKKDYLKLKDERDDYIERCSFIIGVCVDYDGCDIKKAKDMKELVDTCVDIAQNGVWFMGKNYKDNPDTNIYDTTNPLFAHQLRLNTKTQQYKREAEFLRNELQRLKK